MCLGVRNHRYPNQSPTKWPYLYDVPIEATRGVKDLPDSADKQKPMGRVNWLEVNLENYTVVTSVGMAINIMSHLLCKIESKLTFDLWRGSLEDPYSMS